MLPTSLVRSLPWKLTSCTSCQACTLPLGKYSLCYSVKACDRVNLAQILKFTHLNVCTLLIVVEKYYDLYDSVVNKWNKHLCVRRLNLPDIERIAPLEEGCLPHHLAETQKQVRCLWLSVCNSFIKYVNIMHNIFYIHTSLSPICDLYLYILFLSGPWGRFQACVAPSCRVGLQVHPGLHCWRWVILWDTRQHVIYLICGKVFSLSLCVGVCVCLHSYGSDGCLPHRLGEDSYAEPEIHRILCWRADV